MGHKLKSPKIVWIFGLLATVTAIVIPLILFIPKESQASDNPFAGLPVRKPHTDHKDLLAGPYETGSDVTRACLECHQEAAYEVMQTVHWTWESQPYLLPDREEPVTIGKKNSFNNYCIGIQSNWPSCTSCHAGYGWFDANFDFSNQENVDCLVCHDQSGVYAKSKSGLPAEGVDLAVAAQSVALPNRENCGVCHFNGGGGNAVKHGDMDQHLYFPTDNTDVHMGRYDFVCTDCHQAQDHNVKGRAISVSMDLENQVTCTDCHTQDLHPDQRINAHLSTVACQTCHIPSGSTKDPTKMYWDWSTAGQDLPEDSHVYLKIKGSFVYEGDFTPEYYWYKGVADRYLFGDQLDPDGVTAINTLAGDINDAEAKIMPFKVHRGKQPYDLVYNYLLQPQTAGEQGFWSTFDWESALRLGAEASGLPYSGEYGFAETEMYWSLSHLVQPVEKSLQCADCHGENGRLDWQALGYYGDPIKWGGRLKTGLKP